MADPRLAQVGERDQEHRGVRWHELGLRWVPGPSTDPRLPWVKKQPRQPDQGGVLDG